MSHSQNRDPAEGQTPVNPVKLAIYIALGTIALIIGIILVVQLAVSSYGSRSMKGEAAMSDQAVGKRLAPVAQVAVDPAAAAAANAAATKAPAAAMPAAAIPPPAPTQASAGNIGKSTYDSACVACHSSGVAGAPKQGDKAAWAPRLAQGVPALHTAAIKGKGAMPPKGGNLALSDDAVKAAVDYMVAAAK